MIGLMLFILLSAVGFWLQLYAYGIGDRKVILESRICARCDELEMDADADRTQALLPEDRVDRVRNRRSRQVVSAERIIHDTGATVHIGVHPGPVQSAPPAPTAPPTGVSAGNFQSSEHGAAGWIPGFGYWQNPTAPGTAGSSTSDDSRTRPELQYETSVAASAEKALRVREGVGARSGSAP